MKIKSVFFKSLITLLILVVSFSSYAETVFKIEVGNDYSKYSNKDLQKRVWELERAVWQLQQKVFQLEAGTQQSDSWLCKISALGNNFSATGKTKAMAENSVIEKCKAGPSNSDGFFCKNAVCSNE